MIDLSDSHALFLAHRCCLRVYGLNISIVMSITAADNFDNYILRSVIEHIFMPPKLPPKHPGEEAERKTNGCTV